MSATKDPTTARIVAASAAIGVVCVAIGMVWSLLPTATPPSETLLVPLGVLTALVWVPTLIWAVREPRQADVSVWRQGPWGPVFDRLPHGARIFVVVAFVFLALAFVSAIPAIFRGNPEILNGHPVLNNHGFIAQVSLQDYAESVAANTRFGSAVLGGFLLLACASAAGRSRFW